MRKSLCLSLVLLVTSAIFFIAAGANAAALEPLEIRLGQSYSDCKYIETVLGPYLILPLPKDGKELLNATSRLTKIPPDRVREILGAMLHVQWNYPPRVRSQHALFACDGTQVLGLFLSIVRQVNDILNVYSKDNKIVHTALYSNAGLQSLYITGMLAFLKYKYIYINIISPGALYQFSRESNITSAWPAPLLAVREEFKKLAYCGTIINVNVYENKERYIQNIEPENVASMSNSLYIGGDLTTADDIEKFIEPSQPTLSAFDVVGSQVSKTESQPQSPIVPPDVVMGGSGTVN